MAFDSRERDAAPIAALLVIALIGCALITLIAGVM